MASSSTNRTLASSAVAALASIAVAFIGVLPKLRERDRQTIEDQRGRLRVLEMRLEAVEERFGVDPTASGAQERWTISGRVRPVSPTPGGGRYEVYLVAGNRNLASVSDDGRFVFEGLFPGSYSLVARELGPGTNGTVRDLITPEELSGSLESNGTHVEFRVVPGSRPTVAAGSGPPGGVLASLSAPSPETADGGLP